MKGLLITTLAIVAASAHATLAFNSPDFASNAATRSDFLAAAGVANGQYFEDFESYDVGTDMDGAALAGGASLDNTGTGTLTVQSAANQFGGSNPIDTKALRHNESAYVEILFANAATYVGAYGIDHGATTIILTYSDNSTENFSLDVTTSGGDSAEFFGFVAENGLNITKMQLDASGDSEWGIDNLEYGVVPEPATMTLLGLGALAALRRRKK